MIKKFIYRGFKGTIFIVFNINYETSGIVEATVKNTDGVVITGIATANKLEKKSNQVVAVIGDGAISAGMAYEAMNNAGSSKTKMIVILNDNDMSVSYTHLTLPTKA